MKVRMTVFRCGVLLLLVALVSFGIAMKKEKSLDQWLDNAPKITSEAELRKALQGKEKTYVLENMVLGGETTEDPFGLLEGDYLSLEYRQFFYHVRYRLDEPQVPYDFSWILSDTYREQSSSLTLFGDIPLVVTEYEPYHGILKLTKETVKREYWDNLYTDDGHSYYYPEKDFREEEGNCRYDVRGIPVGSLVTFVAKVGKGQVTLSSYQKDKIPRISGENTRSALSYTQDESIGVYAIISFVFGLLGLVLVLYGIVQAIGRLFRS